MAPSLYEQVSHSQVRDDSRAPSQLNDSVNVTPRQQGLSNAEVDSGCLKPFVGIEDILRTSSLDPVQAEELLHTVAPYVDSIVVLGTWFDENGLPEPAMRGRCDAAVRLPAWLPKYRTTIFSGRQRGLEKFLKLHPGSTETEASLGRRYCGTGIVEPLAIDTIGNLLFTAAWLLALGLSCPLIISSASHLAGQVKLIADHLFGDVIRARYWPVPDSPSSSVESILKHAAASYLNPERGLGHTLKFMRDVSPLAVASLRHSILNGVDWLFENDDRYHSEFGCRDAVLLALPI